MNFSHSNAFGKKQIFIYTGSLKFHIQNFCQYTHMCVLQLILLHS